MSKLYRILGVSKNATPKELKSAYRKLAKELHPDHNQGDEKVAERFKEVSAAYSILGDPEMRKKYDNGEIDDNGTPQGGFGGGGANGNPFAGGNPFRGAAGAEMEEILRQFAGGSKSRSSHFTFDDAGGDDFFSNLFGLNRGKRKETRRPMTKGKDTLYKLSVSFIEAIQGTKKRVTLQNSKTIDVKIPEGVKDGQQIRLAEQGEKGFPGGKAGDALIEIKIEKHPYFRREGKDIFLEIPITLDEAILGGKITIPTVWGPVQMEVPKGTSSGKTMRLKGKGVKGSGEAGNQYVSLKIVLPDDLDEELREAIKKWKIRHTYRVREEYDLN